MLRKQVKVLYIAVIILLLQLFLSDTPYTIGGRTVAFFNTENMLEEIPLVKDDFIHSLKAEFDGLASDDYKYNLNGYLTLVGEESDYYLSSDKVTTYSPDKDILTVKGGTVKGAHYFCAWNWTGTTYDEGHHNINYYILMNLNSGWSSSSSAKREWNNSFKLGWYTVTKTDSSGNTYTVDEYRELYQNHHRVSEYFDINPYGSTEPVILKQPFLKVDSSIFADSVTYHTDWTCHTPGKEVKMWGEKQNEYQVYLATAPQMGISTTLSHSFTYEHNNNFPAVTNISSRQGLKVIMARFYREKVDGTLEFVGKSSKSIENAEEAKYGLSNFDITDSDLESFNLDEGRYRYYIGVIDKFNKIYISKPEYFVIDKSAPLVEGAIWTEKSLFKESEPVIFSWNKISDNYSDMAEKDFIFIRLEGENEAKKVSELTDFIVDETSGEIKLVTEGFYYINQFFISDKAGNIGYSKDEVSFYYDRHAPILSLDPTIDPAGLFRSSDSIKILIDEISDINIKELNLEFLGDNNIYDIPHFSGYIDMSEIVIPLSVLAGKEGEFKIYVEVEDKAGNSSIEEYIFKLDDLAPELALYINNTPLNLDETTYFLNHTNLFSISIKDLNYDSVNVLITSDVAGSANSIDITNSGEKSLDITTLEKDLLVDKETLTIVVTARDKNNNVSTISKNFELYDDDAPPLVKATRVEEGQYRIEVDDISLIKKIYIKYINLPEDNIVELDDFTPLPAGTGWFTLSENVRFYDKNIYILPRYAACVFAEDIWGNMSDSSSAGIFMENEKQAASYIINSKSDLDALGWTLYGDILVRTNLSIEAGERLNIITNSINRTNIDFDSSVGLIKLINNGGEINIDSTSNEIVFRGAGASSDEYKWFGILHREGALNIAGPNRISFINARAAITYLNPESDIGLDNITFSDCFIGIHFLDFNSSYNKLTVRNSTFNDSIYGIKFEIDSYEDADLYESALKHLFRENTTFNRIYKGNVYCPVNGNLD